MKLASIIKSIGDCVLTTTAGGILPPALGTSNFEVRGISANSKAVRKGFIFAAIKGTHEDGSRFIQEAIRRGAQAILREPSGESLGSRVSKVAVIKVKDSRKALARLAAAFYGNPSLALKVVGVTGTNGKTTVTYLIEAIVKEARGVPAVIGTVNYRFRNRIITAKNTTPGSVELHSLFADMVRAKVEYAIMEVSSHSLDQHRTEAVHFHSAIFTNLTQDHLDYHKTLRRYFQAKSTLFQKLPPDALCVINNDDTYGRKLKKMTRARIATYAIDTKADIMAKDIRLGPAGTQFSAVTSKGSVLISTSLIGRHNVYNILAALAWAVQERIALRTIKAAIGKFYLIPGRLEPVAGAKDFSVFVDYAHTDDALTNVIGALRQVFHHRIIVVFGCGGQRDKSKRPKMGNVVTELADYAIITNDNPRCENQRTIIEDIKRGIQKSNYRVIPDRLAAIKKALSYARPGDVVLVAGKGHENCQILKDKIIHFDDREAIQKCLRSMN